MRSSRPHLPGRRKPRRYRSTFLLWALGLGVTAGSLVLIARPRTAAEKIVNPDRNIDHRRVPNQMTFMRRHALELPTATTGSAAASWQPGDIVYRELDSGIGHCGIVSDERNGVGLPLVIHNVSGARQEDCLAAWMIKGTSPAGTALRLEVAKPA